MNSVQQTGETIVLRLGALRWLERVVTDELALRKMRLMAEASAAAGRMRVLAWRTS